MLENLAEQFLSGQGQQMEGPGLHENVAQMIGGAQDQHVMGAVGSALSALGAGGFGQSVAQATQNATPEQRNGLADLLVRAISQGGGNPDNAMSQLGIGGSSLGAGELGQLAEHVAMNHPDALAGVLGSQLNSSGGGGGMLSLLGNPMVRQIGMQLAQRVMG